MRAPGFDPQLTIQTHPFNGKRFILYQEDSRSKTNQGGIKGRKFTARTARIYESANVDRCPVRLFQKYTSLLPVNSKTNAFYKKEICERRQTPKQWYVDKPIGINGLRSVVKDMCSKVGLEGRYTNHSLRVSAVTRLYQCGFDEQTIKLYTGHKSDSVRYYKRPHDSLLQSASTTVMSGPSLESDLVKKLKPDFDIDEYQVEDPFKVHVDTSSRPEAHKTPCQKERLGQKCGGICELLKMIDRKNRVKNKVKTLQVSLKFHK